MISVDFLKPIFVFVFFFACTIAHAKWPDINNNGHLFIDSEGSSKDGVYISLNCDLVTKSTDYDLNGIRKECEEVEVPNNPALTSNSESELPTIDIVHSIARQWNELLLFSIRNDFARPTVHARNLFHTSVVTYDAWSVFQPEACSYLLGQTIDGFNCPFTEFTSNQDEQTSKEQAISYACYRLLSHRFQNSPNAELVQLAYDSHMAILGYDNTFTDTNYSTGDPRALGNYIGQCMIDFGLQDGSNEQNGYANTSYNPVNPSMIVQLPGNPNIVDLNRWQPLTLDLFIDQSGNIIPGETPEFLSAEWGSISPFALQDEDKNTFSRNGFDYEVYHDPGIPPKIDIVGGGDSDLYKEGFAMVAIWSSHLDASDGVMWDISPGSIGNRSMLPNDASDYMSFYNYIGGGTVSNGHAVNPSTGAPYDPNIVPRADYARVLAEFWADGPDSETPPGHWFSILNYVSDHPQLVKKFKGQGNVLSDLEWDVKSYFILGGAMHDSAIAAWGIKGWYDYIRPVSAIRMMADLGQSSNPNGTSYHPAGIPLVPGFIEVIETGDALAGLSNEHVGKIKLYAWQGNTAINNVDLDEAGVSWIRAEQWEPYQRPSFVTPPFAGYISGHSTFSRAAAEVLKALTGDAYFPGGMGVFNAPMDEFLVFEDGPSVDIELQWATYQDAADESGLSRIWGGIHPPADDIPGRKIGIEAGQDAFAMASSYFTDSDFDGICDALDPPCIGDFNNDTNRDVADLLLFLSAYGCNENCQYDFNEDGVINAADLLNGMLLVFGTPCE